MITIAFGITKAELNRWKQTVLKGEIAFLTHYWYDQRFPNCKTVTKVGCSNIEKLQAWCIEHKLDPKYIHYKEKYPHFDLLGPYQLVVLENLGLHDHIERFKLKTVHFTDRW